VELAQGNIYDARQEAMTAICDYMENFSQFLYCNDTSKAE